jgi:salicylate biosynthesis isochorismate synthase
MFADLSSLRSLAASPGLTVHEVAIDDVDPIQVARAAHDWSEVIFFHTAHDGSATGLGAAWSLRLGADRFANASLQLAELGLPAEARCFVGFSFDPDGSTAPEWSSFDPLRLVIPRAVVVRTDGGTRLILALTDGEDPAALVDRLEAMVAPDPAVAHSPSDLHVESHPSSSKYVANVAEAIELIANGELQKVVLGRSLVISSDEPPRPFDVLALLSGEHQGSYVYGWRREGAAFIGASPELLVSLIDGHIRSVPFAGTAPRGRNGAEDTQLAARLLDSTKDLSEHGIMVDDIVSRLRPLTSGVVASDPSVERFRHVQHLVTHIEGTPSNGVDVFGLAEALHPTPAVGGVPRAEAMQRIAKLEELDRGWYAGGIGWVSGTGDGEISVALRCALLEGGVSRLYAGAGIVADSEPALELEETRWKFRALHRHLGES